MINDINHNTAANPDDLLRPNDAARLLGVSEVWLKKLRLADSGPRFVRLSERLIRYKRSDLLAWVEARC
ncbi:helix-turn-helix transcriptional regulator [Methylobacterium segetis]|uniref:helix-turn-helix transcriptional regulator n=1 Tax=Methylobacterium segetis TaxID=2488750 RepID=UPI001050368A|nr:helix-turn-helix domain-containing protein [Methylobacterium segetis]